MLLECAAALPLSISYWTSIRCIIHDECKRTQNKVGKRLESTSKQGHTFSKTVPIERNTPTGLEKQYESSTNDSPSSHMRFHTLPGFCKHLQIAAIPEKNIGLQK